MPYIFLNILNYTCYRCFGLVAFNYNYSTCDPAGVDLQNNSFSIYILPRWGNDLRRSSWSCCAL